MVTMYKGYKCTYVNGEPQWEDMPTEQVTRLMNWWDKHPGTIYTPDEEEKINARPEQN